MAISQSLNFALTSSVHRTFIFNISYIKSNVDGVVIQVEI